MTVIHSHMNVTNFLTAFTVFGANWSWWTQRYLTLFAFRDNPIPPYGCGTVVTGPGMGDKDGQGMPKALRWPEAGFLFRVTAWIWGGAGV